MARHTRQLLRERKKKCRKKSSTRKKKEYEKKKRVREKKRSTRKKDKMDRERRKKLMRKKQKVVWEKKNVNKKEVMIEKLILVPYSPDKTILREKNHIDISKTHRCVDILFDISKISLHHSWGWIKKYFQINCVKGYTRAPRFWSTRRWPAEYLGCVSWF